MTEMMTEQPVTAGQELSAQERRREARRMYRESVEAELPMTAESLGLAFGRSTRWGHDRIAEVRADLAVLTNVEAPAQPDESRMQPDEAGEFRMQPDDQPPAPEGAGMPELDPATGGMPPDLSLHAGDEPRMQPDDQPPAPEGAGMPEPDPATGGMPPAQPVESPAARPVRSWPVLLLALPAFVAIWCGWVGIGEMTGFGEINLLPGMVPAGGWATINSAITLPIGVETYAAFALRAWLSSTPGSRARRFAKWSAIGSLALGVCGQVAYHQMAAAGMTVAPWWITALVSALPVAVLGMGTALAHLLRSEQG